MLYLSVILLPFLLRNVGSDHSLIVWVQRNRVLQKQQEEEFFHIRIVQLIADVSSILNTFARLKVAVFYVDHLIYHVLLTNRKIS